MGGSLAGGDGRINTEAPFLRWFRLTPTGL